MKSSADIRRDNKKSIYRFLLEDRGAVRTSRTMEQPEGERLRQYTKQEVAAATGLSPATCNTLLNDMERAGIVQGGRKKAGWPVVCHPVFFMHKKMRVENTGRGYYTIVERYPMGVLWEGRYGASK